MFSANINANFIDIQYNNELTELPLCLLLLYSLDDPLEDSGHHAGVQVPGHLAPDVPAHIRHQPVHYGLNCQALVYKNNNYNNPSQYCVVCTPLSALCTVHPLSTVYTPLSTV